MSRELIITTATPSPTNAPQTAADSPSPDIIIFERPTPHTALANNPETLQTSQRSQTTQSTPKSTPTQPEPTAPTRNFETDSPDASRDLQNDVSRDTTPGYIDPMSKIFDTPTSSTSTLSVSSVSIDKIWNLQTLEPIPPFVFPPPTELKASIDSLDIANGECVRRPVHKECLSLPEQALFKQGELLGKMLSAETPNELYNIYYELEKFTHLQYINYYHTRRCYENFEEIFFSMLDDKLINIQQIQKQLKHQKPGTFFWATRASKHNELEQKQEELQKTVKNIINLLYDRLVGISSYFHYALQMKVTRWIMKHCVKYELDLLNVNDINFISKLKSTMGEYYFDKLKKKIGHKLCDKSGCTNPATNYMKRLGDSIIHICDNHKPDGRDWDVHKCIVCEHYMDIALIQYALKLKEENGEFKVTTNIPICVSCFEIPSRYPNEILKEDSNGEYYLQRCTMKQCTNSIGCGINPSPIVIYPKGQIIMVCLQHDLPSPKTLYLKRKCKKCLNCKLYWKIKYFEHTEFCQNCRNKHRHLR